MAANFTGNRTRDVQASLDICDAVLSFAKRHLRIGNSNRRVEYLCEFPRKYDLSILLIAI